MMREISKETREQYDKILRKYNFLDKTKPKEMLEKLRKMRVVRMNEKEKKKKQLSIGYIKSVMSAFKRDYDGSDQKVLNEYEEVMRSLTERKDKEDKKNKYKNKHEKIDWEKIINSPIIEEGVDRLIRCLYTMFPPRRIKDYANMMYGKSEGNYYYKGYFVFNDYKTQGKFGEQKFKINKKLYNEIEKYIKEQNIREGEPLIQYRKQSDTTNRSSLSRKLRKIFGTSVDGIRHAFITNLYRNPEALYKIDEIQEMMAHDIKTHLRYMDKENKKK